MKFVKSKKFKPIVRTSTIKKSLGPKFQSNFEGRKIAKVGSHNILVESSGKDSFTATYLKKDGSFGKSCTTDGSGAFTVTGCLEKNGIKVIK